MRQISLTGPSLRSLSLQLLWEGRDVSTGTGFVITWDGRPYLITNRHVLSGRDAEDKQVIDRAVAPDSVVITHNSSRGMGQWTQVTEPIVDETGTPLWLEHPRWGAAVDVVALPLTVLDGVQLYPYSLEEPEIAPKIRVPDELSIIGFPYGAPSHEGMGIWMRGTIASEMDIDYEGLPRFLIDSRTRSGQSGSPVIFYSQDRVYAYKEGGAGLVAGTVVQLMGVYSGRIDDRSDIGIVWKSSLIPEIIDGATRGACPRT